MVFDPTSAQPAEATDGKALATWMSKASQGVKASYRSSAAERIVSAFKADDVAGVLKHSERVMPKAVRQGIKREWNRAQGAGDKSKPDEFWAANAGRILGERFTGRGSWRAQAKNWLREATDQVQRTAGLRADAQTVAALNAMTSPKSVKK